jgi:hypothetical protein
MPSNAKNYGRETLHVWGIPADSLANECIVLRLDFAPGVLDAMWILWGQALQNT